MQRAESFSFVAVRTARLSKGIELLSVALKTSSHNGSDHTRTSKVISPATGKCERAKDMEECWSCSQKNWRLMPYLRIDHLEATPNGITKAHSHDTKSPVVVTDAANTLATDTQKNERHLWLSPKRTPQCVFP